MKRKASDELLRSSERVEVASSVTVVDPEGDLQIDFKKDGAPVRPLVGLLVNKHSLCLASPVFRAMLAEKSPFRQPGQKNKDGIQVVYLRDDNPACMLIIMNAIHLQGHRVPQQIKFDQLDRIAVLCDKYDLGRSLGTWGHLWAKPYVDLLGHNCYTRLLFIATVFKIADIFPRVSKHIILRTFVEQGKLCIEDGGGHDFKDGVPETLLNSIAMTRAEIVAQIRATCHLHISMLRRDGGGPVCEYKDMSCDALNLGSVLHKVPDAYNNPDASLPYQHSVHTLMDAIEDIENLEDMEILTSEFKISHSDDCDAGYFLQREAQTCIDGFEGLQLEEMPSEHEPEAPVWLRDRLRSLRERYKDDMFLAVMRYTAVSASTEMPIIVQSTEPAHAPALAPIPADTRFRFMPMIKCLDCPGRLYKATISTDSIRIFEEHLKTELHLQRRKKRLEG